MVRWKYSNESLGVCDEIQHMRWIKRRGTTAQVCEHLNDQEGVCRMKNLRVNVCGKDVDEKSEQHWQD